MIGYGRKVPMLKARKGRNHRLRQPSGVKVHTPLYFQFHYQTPHKSMHKRGEG